MAKRRTKKQKQKTKARQLEGVMATEGRYEENEVKEESAEELRERKLIIRDLIKTGVLAVVILGLLFLIYFRLN